MNTFFATIILTVRNDLGRSPGWTEGPLPVPYGHGQQATRDRRATYIDRRAADALYGVPGKPVRWHRGTERALTAPFSLVALEWMKVRDHSRLAGILIAHVATTDADPTELLPAWSRLIRWKQQVDGKQVLTAAVEDELGREIVLDDAHHAPFRIAFVDSLRDTESPLPTSRLTKVEAWQFAMASGIEPGTFAPSIRQEEDLRNAQVEISSDWSAMVLRDGVAFVGHREVTPAFVAASASGYMRSIYTDALLLGVLQRLVLGDLTDRLAALDDPARRPRSVEALDAEFSRFRNRLWWQHLTQHGPGNDLLVAYGDQHRLPALMEQTKSELEDYSRQASLRASRVLNLVVAVLAVLGAIGAFADVYRFFVEAPDIPAGRTLWIVGGVLTALTLIVLTYPMGLLTRWIPHRRRPYVPRRLRKRGDPGDSE